MIFLTQSFEKNLIFQVERLLKKFYDPAKQEKSLYSGEESRKSNTVANMVTKIDIDALKVKKKSRTNDTENRQKINHSLSQL